MTDTYTDRVIAVEREHSDEAALRLADWTPSGGYTNLVEVASRLGVDLSSVSDGETVGRATVREDGSVVEFHPEIGPDYLAEFDGLEYELVAGIDWVGYELRNLKALGGMEVAELLTYLYDDGYTKFGPMDAGRENGSLTVCM